MRLIWSSNQSVLDRTRTIQHSGIHKTEFFLSFSG
jgi:hypothetical protein